MADTGRISRVERLLEQRYDELIQEYSLLDSEATANQAARSDISKLVSERMESLAEAEEACDAVSEQLTSRGQSMSDTAPLQKIRRALKKLQKGQRCFSLCECACLCCGAVSLIVVGWRALQRPSSSSCASALPPCVSIDNAPRTTKGRMTMTICPL